MASPTVQDASSLPRTAERLALLKAFDDTKAGVKGLVDSGALDKIPQIFIRPPEDLSKEWTNKATDVQIPVIDMSGINDSHSRKLVVEQVRSASEAWGFFQVLNHGIPPSVLDGMIDGIRRFHEANVEEKKKYYSRDREKSVTFNANTDLFYSKSADWRDTLHVEFTDIIEAGEDVPVTCRDVLVEYLKHAMILRDTLLELLSEALGLKSDHLKNMGCSKRNIMRCHYYPACPQPNLTLGTNKHSDPVFLTLLMQNHINALQVLYQDQWVNVHLEPGSLVINIGDFLQLVSNAKFKSCKHRVLARKIGPRISMAFFSAGPLDWSYGPIKELITEENPAVYKEIIVDDYMLKFDTIGLEDSHLALDYYKI